MSPNIDSDLAIKYKQMEYCSSWCDDGWLTLITSVLDKIMFVINAKKYNEYPKIRQIKEKFGQLRVYLDYPDCITDKDIELMESYIDLATIGSEKICEKCGSMSGSRRTLNNFLLKILCDKCMAGVST